MPPKPQDESLPLHRPTRSDGAETRQQILKVAGQLFAEKGFARTTSKEICEVAGSNLAAVNYHFGSRDGLYIAVLVEAHAQIMSLGELEALARTDDDPEQKLRALIALLVGRPLGKSVPWGLRVLINELMIAPSSHTTVLIKTAVFPKVRIIMSIVAGLLDLPVDHPAIQRSTAFVVMPCVMMAIVPGELTMVLPDLKSQPHKLINDMASYALAGLAAIKREYHP